MTNLINICYEFVGLIIGAAMIMFLLSKIESADPESGLHMYNKQEGILFMIGLFVSNIVTNYRFEKLIDRIFFMILLSIMIIHSYTDYKTKTVYRPFNYILWINGIVYFLIKIFVLKDIPLMDGNFYSTIIYTLIFIGYICFMTFKFKVSGKGDGYMLIGIALFMPAITYGTSFLSLEIMLIYYIICGLLQIILNIKKFKIKKLRFTEKLPFAPALFYSIIIMEIITIYIKNFNFFQSFSI